MFFFELYTSWVEFSHKGQVVHAVGYLPLRMCSSDRVSAIGGIRRWIVHRRGHSAESELQVQCEGLFVCLISCLLTYGNSKRERERLNPSVAIWNQEASFVVNGRRWAVPPFGQGWSVYSKLEKR